MFRTLVIISNNIAQRFWPDQEPIGERIEFGARIPMTVIGVVGDVRARGVEREPQMVIYDHFRQLPFSRMVLTARSSMDSTGLAATMRREVRALDPDQPVFNVRTMGDLHDRDLIDARLIVTLVAGFAVVALFLALVGFYGVLSYINAQRLREIGVRVALGAHRRDILGLVVGEGLRLTSIGVGIGLIGSFGLSRLLVSLLFEISPTDLVTFVGLPILMIVVAFVASYVVAARATRVDPVVVLRAD